MENGMTKRTFELSVVGYEPIVIVHEEEDGSRTVEIPGMHLSEDCSEWLFNDDKDDE
jgi:hypothetical protein